MLVLQLQNDDTNICPVEWDHFMEIHCWMFNCKDSWHFYSSLLCSLVGWTVVDVETTFIVTLKTSLMVIVTSQTMYVFLLYCSVWGDWGITDCNIVVFSELMELKMDRDIDVIFKWLVTVYFNCLIFIFCNHPCTKPLSFYKLNMKI